MECLYVESSISAHQTGYYRVGDYLRGNRPFFHDGNSGYEIYYVEDGVVADHMWVLADQYRTKDFLVYEQMPDKGGDYRPPMGNNTFHVVIADGYNVVNQKTAVVTITMVDEYYCKTEGPTRVPSPSPIIQGCCNELTADCLACHLGVSVTEYCLASPITVDCDVDACVDYPCENEGTCLDVAAGPNDVSGRTCTCPLGFRGVSCETACCNDLTVDCLTCLLDESKNMVCAIFGGSIEGCEDTTDDVEWVLSDRDRKSCTDVCEGLDPARTCNPEGFEDLMNDVLDTDAGTAKAEQIFADVGASCPNGVTKSKRNVAGYNMKRETCVTSVSQPICARKSKSDFRPVCPCAT